MITVIIGVLVLIGGGVTAVLFLSDGNPDRPPMAANSHFDGLAFPDPAALDYAKGPKAVCEAMGKTMLARGYQYLSGTDDNTAGRGYNCRFGTPGTSLLEDGSYQLTVDIFVTTGKDASTAYDSFLNATVRAREKLGSDPLYVWSELYEMKLGEEGFFSHSEFKAGPAGNATAAFRSDDAMFRIGIGGAVTHLGKDKKNEPLTEEVTRSEVVDIVKSLSGDKSAGLTRIKPSPLKDPQGLPPLGNPKLPEDGDTAARCAPATSVAGQFGLKTDKTAPITGAQSGVLCVYKPSDDVYRQKNDYITRNLEVATRSYKDARDDVHPTEALAADLRAVVQQSTDGKTTLGQLYRLPIGESGYMVYAKSENVEPKETKSSGRLTAGYVLDDVYVKITISGATWTHPSRGKVIPVALTEQALVADLVQLLTAMKT